MAEIQAEEFRQWCVVEIMGHKRFAGLVTEQQIGGNSFLRVDVPEVVIRGGGCLPAFTKLFGTGSVYCITPCTEETARQIAEHMRESAFPLYDVQKLLPVSRSDSSFD